MSPPQTSNQPQLSPLRAPKTLLTGHSPSGHATIHSSRPANWTVYDDRKMGFNVNYTTSTFPADLNNNTDIVTHDAVLSSSRLGLVNPNGTVCRTVDFAPGFDCMMHRTQSLDYGIVVAGEIELVLDSGECEKMGVGDVCVQRGTMHAWRNPSGEQWARMVFVLQDCAKIVGADGAVLGEDLGRGTEGLPASGNDV